MVKRYFYDWEFDEASEPGKVLPISVGVVDDSGRKLYLINENYINGVKYGYIFPSQWLKENVLNHITEEDMKLHSVREEQLGPILRMFISDYNKIVDRDDVELWGYFSAYDHFVLAQRFGTMINLPQPIPMNTYDVKQLMNDNGLTRSDIHFDPESEHHPLHDAEWNKRVWEYIKGETWQT